MRYGETTFPLDSDNRIAVWQDEYFIDYLTEWDHDCFGLWTLDAARGLRNLELNASNHAYDLTNIREWQTRDNAANEMLKHLRRAGYLAKEIALRGYSQSEWLDALIWTTLKNNAEEALEAFEDELQSWFRDGFYNVALEKRVVYTAPDRRTLEQWEIEHAIGGVLFTNNWKLTKENAMEVLA